MSSVRAVLQTTETIVMVTSQIRLTAIPDFLKKNYFLHLDTWYTSGDIERARDLRCSGICPRKLHPYQHHIHPVNTRSPPLHRNPPDTKIDHKKLKINCTDKGCRMSFHFCHLASFTGSSRKIKTAFVNTALVNPQTSRRLWCCCSRVRLILSVVIEGSTHPETSEFKSLLCTESTRTIVNLYFLTTGRR